MLYRGRLNGGRLRPAGVGEGQWAGPGKVWADDQYWAVGDYLRAASRRTAASQKCFNYVQQRRGTEPNV